MNQTIQYKFGTLLSESALADLWHQFPCLDLSLVLCVCVVTEVNASVYSDQRNIAVLEGSQVQLTCTVVVSCLDVSWYKRCSPDCQLSNRGVIVDGYTLHGDFTDNPSRSYRDCSLNITRATLSHAGKYCCSFFPTEGSTPLLFYVSVIGKQKRLLLSFDNSTFKEIVIYCRLTAI